MDENKIIKFEVDEELSDTRADIGLAQYGVLSSRSQIRKLFDHKLVIINELPSKPSYILQEGDVVQITIKNIEKEELLPYPISLDIVYEDDDLLVINKPAGLVVHPACGHKNDTLINALIAHQIKLSPGSSPYRPGLVHRIDKDTSGLLVLAKNEKTHNSLARQFKDKTTHRIYQALVFGHLKEMTGTIDTYITRSSSDRKKFIASNEEIGKHAITHYKVKLQSHHFSLLELRLETGRTHQIRVHMNFIKHPIVGDDTYGGKKRANNLASQELKKYIKNMERFALHAMELGFIHPTSKEKMLFRVPWPEDLKGLFELVQIDVECQ